MDVSNDCAKDYNLGLCRTKGTNGQLRREPPTAWHRFGFILIHFLSDSWKVFICSAVKERRKRFIIRSHRRQAEKRRGQNWRTVSRLSFLSVYHSEHLQIYYHQMLLLIHSCLLEGTIKSETQSVVLPLLASSFPSCHGTTLILNMFRTGWCLLLRLLTCPLVKKESGKPKDGTMRQPNRHSPVLSPPPPQSYSCLFVGWPVLSDAVLLEGRLSVFLPRRSNK